MGGCYPPMDFLPVVKHLLPRKHKLLFRKCRTIICGWFSTAGSIVKRVQDFDPKLLAFDPSWHPPIVCFGCFWCLRNFYLLNRTWLLYFVMSWIPPVCWLIRLNLISFVGHVSSRFHWSNPNYAWSNSHVSWLQPPVKTAIQSSFLWFLNPQFLKPVDA